MKSDTNESSFHFGLDLVLLVFLELRELVEAACIDAVLLKLTLLALMGLQ